MTLKLLGAGTRRRGRISIYLLVLPLITSTVFSLQVAVVLEPWSVTELDILIGGTTHLLLRFGHVLPLLRSACEDIASGHVLKVAAGIPLLQEPEVGSKGPLDQPFIFDLRNPFVLKASQGAPGSVGLLDLNRSIRLDP